VKILLCTDGSKYSEAATEAVLERGSSQDGEFRILSVVDNLDDAFPEIHEYCVEHENGKDPRFKAAESIVESTARRLRAKGLHVTTEVEWGDPKTHIVDVARRWHADLIVLGSHGRKGLEHFLLGSVSETVARHAPCSVAIIRRQQPH